MADRKSFLLRIDPALWSELEGWAQAELRSVNGQIEYLLRDAVARRKHLMRPGAESPHGSTGAPVATPAAGKARDESVAP